MCPSSKDWVLIVTFPHKTSIQETSGFVVRPFWDRREPWVSVVEGDRVQERDLFFILSYFFRC